MRFETLPESAARERHPAPPAAPRQCEALAGLAGTSVAERFRIWSGRSGRRYLFSVMAGDETRADPVPERAVVIGVARDGAGERIPCFVLDTGAGLRPGPQAERLRAWRRRPGGELHLHLLAADAEERRRIARDLDPA